MTTTFETDGVRVQLPERPTLFLPGSIRAQQGNPLRYQGLFHYVVRDGHTGRVKAEGFGHALPSPGGLIRRWQERDDLQELFPTPAAFAAAVLRRMATGVPLPVFGYGHNERIQNGGRMLAKNFWGATSSPQVSTVNVPSYIALNSGSTFTAGNFTWAHNGTDLSCGTGSGSGVGAGVTTYEYTASGLSRANGTVATFADQTALDGVATLTVKYTFTCTSGPQTVYGAALFDASSTATCNIFAEAPCTSATLQTNDTFSATWNISF